MEQAEKPIKSFPQQENSVEEISHLFAHLRQNSEANHRLLEWAGILALENKQWTGAENIFSFLLERRDKALDWMGLAKTLRHQNKLDEAKDCYQEAVSKITEPCSLLFIAYKSLGEIHFLKEDLFMAEEYFNKAGVLNPHSKELVFCRAMISLREKKYHSAEKLFQAFLKTHSKSIKAWIGLALARKATGDEELALACLDRSLDLDPQCQKALNLKNKWLSPLSQRLSGSLSFCA